MVRGSILGIATALLVSCGHAEADVAEPGEPLVPAPACAAVTRTETIDLLPVARLGAVGTATTFARWTREDRDEPYALRDDDPDNGWAPGDDGEAIAEIDLGPAGGPFALRSLSLTWDVMPGAVEVRVRDACGGGLVARATQNAPTVPLGGVCGACVEIVARDADGARLTSAKLESASDVAVAPLLPEPPKVAKLADRGVVEGFYGRPWTWDERTRIVDALAAAGLGLYVYAPKDDPLHRKEWRTPYGEEFVTKFGALAKAANARGVRAVMAVSPFIDFDEAAGDEDRVVAKLRPFVEAGAAGIALFADDIELVKDRPIDGALGALHAKIVNDVVTKLRAARPDLVALFVGTVYSDARRASWPASDAYLEALRALDPAVSILWTGSDTNSPSLSASVVAPVASLVERKPAIWDNHWATDGYDTLYGAVMLAPLRARSADLLDATSAILENPSIPGATARVQVSLLGAWAAGPAAGDDAQRMAAAALEARFAAYPGDPAPRAALVKRVMELFEGSGLRDDLPRHHALEGALAHVGDALASGTAPPLDDLRRALSLVADARTTGSEVHHSTLAIDLVDELAAPLGKVAAAAHVLLLAFERIATVRSGGDATSLSARLAEADAALEGASRFRFLDDGIHAFVARALAAKPAAGSLARPTTGAELPTCVVGRELSIEPFTNASSVEAHGLAGAIVEGARVRWTAPHPGRFDVVFVAPPDPAHPDAFATRSETLVCRPS